MLASLLHVSQPHTHSHTLLKDVVDVQVSPLLNPMSPAMDTNMDVLLADVKSLFESPLQPKNLYNMSRRLQDEFRQKLESSNISMLPSFHHTLPTGQEQGTILALDVGGSTFRIALIDLTGRKELRQESNGEADGLKIKRLKSFPIDDSVRSLRGRLFFDWMACRIEEVLDADDHQAEKKVSGPLPMSLAWSFPIEETSSRSGSLLAMGKGFLATSGVEGQDICELVTSACQARSLNVELQGIVNDASATLLSQAYRDPSTRISLIMGTGINSAVYLPLNSLGKEKFGERESSWWNEARHVLVNTELSMFGKHIWESTRWDDKLNAAHPLPDFQPLEYKVGGRFLGELVRLVVVEAVHQGVIFNGAMPKGLDVAYGFDTGLIGVFERYVSTHLSSLLTFFGPLLSHSFVAPLPSQYPKLTIYPTATQPLISQSPTPISPPPTPSPTMPPNHPLAICTSSAPSRPS